MARRPSHRALLTRAGMLIALLAALLVPGLSPAGAADPPIAFGFEDGVGGWFAPDWLAANAGQPSQDSTHASQGSSSLALPVHLTGGGFDQAGAVRTLDNKPVDLLGYRAIAVDVLAPVANLYGDIVFNDPWHPPVDVKPLQVGWNTLTFDLTQGSAEFPGGVGSANEIILRVVGKGASYDGPVWFDDVRVVPTTDPIVRVLSPQQDATVTVPEGGRATISAQVSVGAGRSVELVGFSAGGQSGAMQAGTEPGTWTGSWDTWAGGDGLRTVTVTAVDSTGASGSTSATVLVRDSLLDVRLQAPSFDARLRGRAAVTATVTPDPRFRLRRVEVAVDDLRVPMRLGAPGAGGAMTATATLDTRRLRDGAHTLRVVAHDRRFEVAATTDLLVANAPPPADLVRAHGTVFSAGRQRFRYIGWNEYELFTRQDRSTAHLQQDVRGTVIPAGTVQTWREQIDRQMLEARRHGLTVLRTWAFDENNEPIAFQPSPGVYNEQTFQRLDYIMDSARRHGIRVILTLANYWPDYGGTNRYAQWLGLPNKLRFFTDPGARDLYERYVGHVVGRVNTVNGVAYRDDPTLFSWEPMNEPRMDCADDPSPQHSFCDPTGATLRAWLAREVAFIKGLDPRHMVSVGGEGHGLVRTPSGPFQWARDDEGGGNTPYDAYDVPGVDFLTYHPYPNASWAQYTLAQTHDLIRGLTISGRERGKPIVMEEYGVDRTQSVTDESGTRVGPNDPAYDATRVRWYAAMLDDCYRLGCAGSNVWMIADWADANLNVNPWLPADAARRDAPLIALFDRWARRLHQL